MLLLGVLALCASPRASSACAASDVRTHYSAVSRARERLRQCFERSLRTRPNLSGRLVVSVLIAGDGRAREVTLRDELGAPELAECVRGVFLRIVYEATGDEQRLEIPLVFRPA